MKKVKSIAVVLMSSILLSCTAVPAFALSPKECNAVVQSIPDMNKILQNQPLSIASKGLRSALQDAGIPKTTVELHLAILDYVDEVKDRYSVQKQQQEIYAICIKVNNKKGNV